jgi:hypothetical protein
MNLNKSLEFFDPMKCEDQIHIIGLGAIGSNLVDMFARLGLTNLHLYDFDTVTAHNIANQRYDNRDIGIEKTICMLNKCHNINALSKPKMYLKGYQPGMQLRGHVFLAVDNIDLRRAIVTEHMYNPNILTFHDVRMRLQDAQYYMANWTQQRDKDSFLASMQFTHEEAKESTPVSACGTTLSVMPTVNMICSAGVANFMNFIKEGTYHRSILVDAFTFNLLAM